MQRSTMTVTYEVNPSTIDGFIINELHLSLNAKKSVSINAKEFANELRRHKLGPYINAVIKTQSVLDQCQKTLNYNLNKAI
jgi:hypothetical protein